MQLGRCSVNGLALYTPANAIQKKERNIHKIEEIACCKHRDLIYIEMACL